MPELPEVETVRAGLAPHLVGRRIEAVTLNRAGLRQPFSPHLVENVQGQRVMAVRRRAKYLLIDLARGETLIAHLGMSGTMVLVPHNRYQPRTHDHVLIDLDSGLRLVFNDPRRFGLLLMEKTAHLAHHPLLKSLGIEPLDPAFTPAYLAQRLAQRKGAIKQVIMDQAVVVGVGNIYASEALFHARIHPQQAASQLSAKHRGALVRAIVAVLQAAIASGGSTLRDYVRSTGDAGYFQHQFAVYGRVGKPCERCASPIQQITQGARSTYFCNKCQCVK